MGLKEYAQKRDFKKTPEPAPEQPAAGSTGRGGFFCVQRHDASRLHYDFRLEVNGLLVSWAVPKGPSLDPDRKSLAMKVEDHPLDYGTFEGNIPAGNYGGGSVMLWDTGTFNVLGEPSAQEQLDRGDFKFELHGTKLKGSFAIVHIKGSPKRSSKGNEWLLLKKKDEFAVPQYDIDHFAFSVKTQRTQAEIASDAAPVSPDALPGARKAASPASISPMLATLATKPPAGSQWLYEVKWDGVRALCHLRNGELAIFSRRGLRCEKQYPELANLAAHLNAEEAWLDGEICVLDEHGRSRFELIQPRIHANLNAVKSLSEASPVTLFLFDLLYLDGYDLRGATLEDRKRLLARIVTPAVDVRISEAFETDGEHMFQAARQMNLEGMVAKDRHSRYAETRSSAWQKLKVNNEDEFVIAGFTKGGRDYFGALVLGVKDGNSLRHVGQVGTGFDQKLMKEIHARLEPLITKASPIKPKPNVKDVTWVKPEVVCQVRFLERTQDGMLRAPVFVALRDDKTVEETVEPACERKGRGCSPPHRKATRAKPWAASLTPQPSCAIPQEFDWSGHELITDVDGHRLKFTNLDKLFFPKDGWKKRDLLRFYDSVSPWLLPHLKNRPLSMKRYPNGIAQDYFFQKNATHFPGWLHCIPIEESDPPKTNNYPLANDKASLLYLVNLGCVDQNPFMSRVESLDKPDWMLLDLDPVDTSYDQIVEAALLIRGLLAELGLQGYPKTTGGDGMHIYVPLEPVYSFEQVRSFAEILSHLAVERAPNLFTTPRSVEKRKKERVYFDYLQIGSGKTISSPYVVRAYDGAPVATPLAWGEVVRGLRPQHFRIDNAIARFQQVGDLFAPVLQGGQRLETALERLQQPAKPAKKRAKTSTATRS